jgi:hypothetical protein
MMFSGVVSPVILIAGQTCFTCTGRFSSSCGTIHQSLRMNFKHSLSGRCIVAATTSAAWSQKVPTPIPYRTPIGSPSDASGAAPFYPTQLEQVYGLVTLQGDTGTAAVQNNGAGQTIAIIGAYDHRRGAGDGHPGLISRGVWRFRRLEAVDLSAEVV